VRYRSDERVLGAVLAGAIALAVSVVGGVLLLASVSAGAAPVAVGLVGVVVGPVTAWRLAPAAGRREHGWQDRAIATMLVATTGVALALAAFSAVSAVLGRDLASDAWIAAVSFAYAAFVGTVLGVVLTFGVGVPLGLFWTWAFRRIRAGSDSSLPTG
jgi:hypothetical protein